MQELCRFSKIVDLALQIFKNCKSKPAEIQKLHHQPKQGQRQINEPALTTTKTKKLVTSQSNGNRYSQSNGNYFFKVSITLRIKKNQKNIKKWLTYKK